MDSKTISKLETLAPNLAWYIWCQNNKPDMKVWAQRPRNAKWIAEQRAELKKHMEYARV